MNPMTDQDFMGQMASFSTLEQVTNLAASNAKLASGAALDQAVGLIGRRVTYTDTAARPAPASSSASPAGRRRPSLTVDGVDGVDPSSITEVA